MEDRDQGPGTGDRVRGASAGSFLAVLVGREVTKSELGDFFPTDPQSPALCSGPRSLVPGPP